MASEHLLFRIGSVVTGDGFKQIQKTVQGVNGRISESAGRAQAMTEAFSQLDGQMSKSMQAMSGMLQSLLTFNVASIATTAALLYINKCVQESREEMEALTERANALKSSVDKAFSQILAKNINEIVTEVRSLGQEFEATTAHALAITAAINSLHGAEREGSVIDLEIEKLNALLEAHSEAERKQIETTYALQIATEKAANAREEWNEKNAAALEEYHACQKRIVSIDNQIATLEERRALLDEQILVAKESGSEKWKEMQAAREKLDAEETALRLNQSEAWKKLALADVNMQKVREESVNAEAQHQLAIKEATLAKQKLAEEERLAAEKVFAESTARAQAEAERERAKAAQKTLTDTREEAAELQKEVNDGASRLKEAERDYAAALEAYNANFDENKMWETFYGASTSDKFGMRGGYSVGTINALSESMVENAVKNAIKSGEVRTVKELDTYMKQVGRTAKTNVNQAKVQAQREKQRYERLRDQKRKTWSKADTKFYENYEKLKAHAEAAKREIEEKKQRLVEEQRQLQDNHDNLKKIKEKLEQLGAA